MDFSLSDEQQLFRSSVKRFIAEQYGFPERLKISAEGLGFRESHWQSFAELGWLALPLPEDYGGLGGTAFDTMVLMQAFGRGLVASPYLSSIVLGGGVLAAAGSDAQKQEYLPALAEGRCRLAFAFAEPLGRYDLADVATRALPKSKGYTLDGHKSVVFYAEAADTLIVTARTAGAQKEAEGLSLFLVDAGAPGVTARHGVTHDGGRASELTFSNVSLEPASLIGEPDRALPVVERVIDQATVAVLAEALGAMWMIHEETLSYLKTREQFGRKLSEFQALQHRLVDTYINCQLAESLVVDAAGALAADAGTRRRAVSAAKIEVGRLALLLGQEGIQLHGGMGMMRELPVGHAYKRLTLINNSFGDPAYHLGRYQA